MDGRDGTSFQRNIIIYLRLLVVVLISFPITFNGNTETETDELLFNSGRLVWSDTRQRNYSTVHLPQDAMVAGSRNHRLGGDKVI